MNIKRKLAIEEFTELVKKIKIQKSFGISGSSAFGFHKINSDIDFWICIDKKHAEKFFKDKVTTKLFYINDKSFYNAPVREFHRSQIDVINLKTKYLNIPCGLDVYSRKSFADICNLRNFIIKRWRENGITKKKIGFKNCCGEIIYENCTVKDWYSSIKNVIIKNNIFYYGQHVDRITASKILIDELDVSEDILFLWIKIVLHAKKLNVKNLDDFLFRKKNIPENINIRMDVFLNLLVEDIKKWQKSLKLMATT